MSRLVFLGIAWCVLLVAQVSVQMKQRVTPGMELLVIEAMKMQNSIRAQRVGVVKAIHVAKGSTVAAEQLLIELE